MKDAKSRNQKLKWKARKNQKSERQARRRSFSTERLENRELMCADPLVSLPANSCEAVTTNSPESSEGVPVVERFVDAGNWATANTGEDEWYVGDFNGDGTDDVFRVVPEETYADVFLSSGSTFVHSGSWTDANPGERGWSVGDFNGDGMDDLLGGATMYLSNGTGFVNAGKWTRFNSGERGWHVGDFNGDGMDDVFRFVYAGKGTEVFLSDGKSFEADGSWLTGIKDGDQGWHVGDFNGDGKDDIFRVTDKSGADVFLSTGTEFASAESWTEASASTWQVGDFNGDGRDDIVSLANELGSQVYVSVQNGFSERGIWGDAMVGVIGDFDGDGAADVLSQQNANSHVFLSSALQNDGADSDQLGIRFDAAASWATVDSGQDGWQVGDFNGDGSDDLLRIVPDETYADVFLSSGSTLVHSGSWTDAYPGERGWSVGDFNGDGMDDLLGGATVHLSNGTGFVNSGKWTRFNSGDRGWHVGDFNGDGMDDVFRFVYAGKGTEVYLSDGKSFVADGSWLTGVKDGNQGWHVGDFNGDGKDDIFRVTEESGADIFLSTGTEFASAGGWAEASNGSDWRVADFNGDGRDDIFRRMAEASVAEVLFSDGSRFASDGILSLPMIFPRTTMSADFNGDGRSDILRYSPGVNGVDVMISQASSPFPTCSELACPGPLQSGTRAQSILEMPTDERSVSADAGPESPGGLHADYAKGMGDSPSGFEIVKNSQQISDRILKIAGAFEEWAEKKDVGTFVGLLSEIVPAGTIDDKDLASTLKFVIEKAGETFKIATTAGKSPKQAALQAIGAAASTVSGMNVGEELKSILDVTSQILAVIDAGFTTTTGGVVAFTGGTITVGSAISALGVGVFAYETTSNLIDGTGIDTAGGDLIGRIVNGEDPKKALNQFCKDLGIVSDPESLAPGITENHTPTFTQQKFVQAESNLSDDPRNQGNPRGSIESANTSNPIGGRKNSGNGDNSLRSGSPDRTGSGGTSSSQGQQDKEDTVIGGARPTGGGSGREGGDGTADVGDDTSDSAADAIFLSRSPQEKSSSDVGDTPGETPQGEDWLRPDKVFEYFEPHPEGGGPPRKVIVTPDGGIVPVDKSDSPNTDTDQPNNDVDGNENTDTKGDDTSDTDSDSDPPESDNDEYTPTEGGEDYADAAPPSSGPEHDEDIAAQLEALSQWQGTTDPRVVYPVPDEERQLHMSDTEGHSIVEGTSQPSDRDGVGHYPDYDPRNPPNPIANDLQVKHHEATSGGVGHYPDYDPNNPPNPIANQGQDGDVVTEVVSGDGVPSVPN